MRLKTLMALLLVASLATASRAAELELNQVTLVVKHYDGKVEFTDRGVMRTPNLQPSMTIRLGENDIMSLVVEQTNPLLFTYALKDGPPVENQSYASALKAQALLKIVTGMFGQGQNQNAQIDEGAEDALAAVGFTPEFAVSFANNVDAIQTAVTSIPGLVTKSGDSWPDALAVRQTTQDWTALLDRTEAQLVVITKADEALYNFARTQLTPRPATNLGSGDGFQPTGGALNGGNPPPNPPAGNPPNAPANPVIDPNAQQSFTPPSGSTRTGANAGPLQLALNYMIRHKGDVDKSIAALRTFQKVASGIGKTIRKDDIRASFKEDRSQILTITAQEDAGGAVAAAKPKAGVYTFLIHPDTSVTYEFIEPAVIYSLVEREDWDTRATADGKFEIVRTDKGNELNGTTIAGMLSITPRKLSDWSFAPSFQLGFSPVKDRFGIFGGISFRVLDLFKVGGGIAYQQTEKLSSSQQAGQILLSADDLKVDVEPDTGFYFGITVDLGKK